MDIDAPDAALVLRRIKGVARRAGLIRVTSRRAVDAAAAIGGGRHLDRARLALVDPSINTDRSTGGD